MHISVVINKEHPALLENVVTGPGSSDRVLSDLSFRKLGDEMAAATKRGKFDDAELTLLDISTTLDTIHLVVLLGA